MANQKANIIIVEDEAIVAEEIKTSLEGMGYFVTSIVKTGESAIEKAEQDRPDVILMDIRLEGQIDGIEAAEHIRSHFDIPVIFLTAYADEEKLDRAKLALPFGYLIKPIQTRDLVVTIEMALFTTKADVERKRAEAALQKAHDELERRVKERTAELAKSNEQLKRETEERKRAEEKIRESEARYRGLFEDSRDAIDLVTEEGRFIDINQAGLDLFGYTREEVMRMNISELYVYPDDRSRFQQEIDRKGYVRDYELILQNKDRTEMDCLVTVTAKRADDGSITRYQSIIRDVTEYKELEKQVRQAQKMEAIGTLAGGIAHDFNNILSAIVGYTEISQIKLPENSDVHADLDEVLKASNRATDLVQQILTFSRQTEQEMKPVQVKMIAEEVLKLLRASLPTTIEIRRKIKSDSIVVGDPTQIHQILMNLCTNAGHAMQENDGILEVGLVNVELDSDRTVNHPDLKPGPYLKLTVSDTGHGMPPDVLNKIFDPFFTTKEKGVGTGMGLSVVHGIVESFGGGIHASSEPGKGSSFEVFLPAVERSFEPEIKTKKTIPKGTERILYVDDEHVLIASGKTLLEALGYKVKIKTSSIEALELFKEKPDEFDIIITDMTMPHMTGDELAEALISIRSDIPVILCTGFSTKVTEEKAQNIGIRALVMKPVAIHEMANTIRSVLDEK